MKAVAIGAVMVIAAQNAAAGDADWAYSATLYGWVPGMTTAIETEFGTIESESSASDALSDIDMVFMGTFAAQRDRWGFVGDLLYIDLSNEQGTPLGLFGEARAEVSATAISGYALYRLTGDPAIAFDIGAGFRAFDLKVDLALTPRHRVRPIAKRRRQLDRPADRGPGDGATGRAMVADRLCRLGRIGRRRGNLADFRLGHVCDQREMVDAAWLPLHGDQQGARRSQCVRGPWRPGSGDILQLLIEREETTCGDTPCSPRPQARARQEMP
jgi:hypothetical protein